MNEEMMIRYLQGACSPEEKIRFEAWLAESGENREQFHQTRVLWHASRIDHFRSAEPLNNAVATFNRNVQYSRQQRQRRLYVQVARYAAILVAATGFLWMYLVLRGHKESDHTMIVASVSRTDSSKLVILDDGSRVWLNSNSRITYPRRFSNDKRTVAFEGEAYFEVAPDAARPFIVQTSVMQVKVLGTAFNIQAYAGNDRAEAVLISGKIAIGDSSGSDLVVMSPGQKGLIGKNGKNATVTNVNPGAYTSWRYGQITLDGATMETIAHRLSELYQVKVFVDPGVNNTARYNFTFSKTKPVADVMDMLCFIAPVHYHMQEKEIVITK